MILYNYFKLKDAKNSLSIRGVGVTEGCNKTISNILDINGSELAVLDGINTQNSTNLTTGAQYLSTNGRDNLFSTIIPSASVNTDFSYTDYAINAISNVTQSTINVSTLATNNGSESTITATFTNSNVSDIVINSIGLTFKQYKGAGSYYGGFTSQEILIAEMELDTPLTVPAGVGFTITVLWNENK